MTKQMNQVALTLRIVAVVFAIACVGQLVAEKLTEASDASQNAYDDVKDIEGRKEFVQQHPNMPPSLEIAVRMQSEVEERLAKTEYDAGIRWRFGFGIVLFFASYIFTGLGGIYSVLEPGEAEARGK
jgi:hypothetical protein